MPPRKRPRSPQSTYAESFKIKLGEAGNTYSTAELRAMANEAIDLIEALGIPRVKPCNWYVPPLDEKDKPIIRVRGNQLEDLTIAGPYRSAADEHGL